MKKLIKEIENSRVTKIIAGGSNGSIILFDLTKENEKYVLYIYCSWRLLDKDTVITGSNDDSISKDSFFVKEIKKLKNILIKGIQVNEFGDFSLIFDNGKKLDVFCDLTSNGERDEVIENWTICNLSENKCSSLTNYFTLFEETYNS